MSGNTGGFFYEVRATILDESAVEPWLAWMRDVHLDDVVAAGALDGRLVRLDGSPPSFAAQYRFTSREAFEAYLRDHASRLRAEGLARFGDRVRYSRSNGDIVFRTG